MRDTLGVLLAGGAGERLYPLTRDRAKPAVTFGGIYRIIDITLSNCINSDLRRVYILTQYKALSLNRHIREGWGNIVGQELGEFIEILPPMKRVSENWYMGTADAVYQNIYSIGSEQPRYVLILSGDHIYKMNYDLMLRQHKDSGADVTLATILIDPTETKHFGVVEIDRTGRVVGFQEKPEETDLRSPYNPRMVSASMGVYLFNTDVLIPVLLKDAEDPASRHDFGHNILPRMVDDYKVYSFNFIDENRKEALYWRDVGTLEAYYEANMDLVSVAPVFNLYDSAWPIRTHMRQYPPAKFVFNDPGRTGEAHDSIVSMGCIISGSSVQQQRSVARRPRQFLLAGRYQHPLFARERWPPLPHPQGHHRSRRSDSGRHGHRLRHRSRSPEISRHRQRHHRGDARLFAVRESHHGRLLHLRIIHGCDRAGLGRVCVENRVKAHRRRRFLYVSGKSYEAGFQVGISGSQSGTPIAHRSQADDYAFSRRHDLSGRPLPFAIPSPPGDFEGWRRAAANRLQRLHGSNAFLGRSQTEYRVQSLSQLRPGTRGEDGQSLFPHVRQ